MAPRTESLPTSSWSTITPSESPSTRSARVSAWATIWERSKVGRGSVRAALQPRTHASKTSERRRRVSAITGERNYEAQDEAIAGAGSDSPRPLRSVAQGQARESPGHKGPPVEEKGVRRCPSENEPKADASSESSHGAL